MNFFAWWRRPEIKALTPENAFSLLVDGGGIATRAGQAVGPESALRVPAFAGAVRLVSEALAALPCRVVRLGADGSREVVRDDPRRDLLDVPCPWLGWSDFVEAMTRDAILHGRSIAIPTRVRGEVRELQQLPPGAFSVEVPIGELEPRYRVTLAGGEQVIYRRSELLVIEHVGGRSAVNLLRETLGLALALQAHASNLFGRGLRPGGFLKPDADLSPDARKRLKSAFEALYGGADGAGRVMILEPGLSFDPAVMTSVDAQYVEIWRHVILEICRTMRVSPHQMAELQRATYSNSEVLFREFVAFTLLHWVRHWESALELVLLTREERRTHEIELDLSEMTRGEFLPRMKALAEAVNAGLFTPNEARATEGRPPKEGGDELRVSTNSVRATEEPADAS